MRLRCIETKSEYNNKTKYNFLTLTNINRSSIFNTYAWAVNGKFTRSPSIINVILKKKYSKIYFFLFKVYVGRWFRLHFYRIYMQ